MRIPRPIRNPRQGAVVCRDIRTTIRRHPPARSHQRLHRDPLISIVLPPSTRSPSIIKQQPKNYSTNTFFSSLTILQ